MKKKDQHANNERVILNEKELTNDNLQAFDPKALCPLHPHGHHIWQECSVYKCHFLNQPSQQTIDSLTLNPSPELDKEDVQSLEAPSLSAELARWHFWLGHLSYDILKQLAKRGEIPCKLKDAVPPKCTGCLFGAMTKVPWRTKGQQNQGTVFVATYPGQCTSVDQFQSTQVGFIAQLKGKPTTQ